MRAPHFTQAITGIKARGAIGPALLEQSRFSSRAAVPKKRWPRWRRVSIQSAVAFAMRPSENSRRDRTPGGRAVLKPTTAHANLFGAKEEFWMAFSQPKLLENSDQIFLCPFQLNGAKTT